MRTHEPFSEMSTPELVTALADRHARLRSGLPWIRAMTMKVAKVHGEKDADLVELDRLVGELVEATLPHLELEAQLRADLTAGGEPPAGRADVLVDVTEQHQELGQLLDRIRVAASDFAVPGWACVTYRKLMSELGQLEAELLGCIHIENHELLRRTLPRR
jgi:regulator of cell morphogenesis and NO signaling